MRSGGLFLLLKWRGKEEVDMSPNVLATESNIMILEFLLYNKNVTTERHKACYEIFYRRDIVDQMHQLFC
jgi:hypothetical protein